MKLPRYLIIGLVSLLALYGTVSLFAKANPMPWKFGSFEINQVSS